MTSLYGKYLEYLETSDEMKSYLNWLPGYVKNNQKEVEEMYKGILNSKIKPIKVPKELELILA